MAKKVVVAGACRTAIGKMGGALANVPATELGAIVIREALGASRGTGNGSRSCLYGMCHSGGSRSKCSETGFYQGGTSGGDTGGNGECSVRAPV